MFLINEYVEVHGIYCFVFVFYRGIELGIENWWNFTGIGIDD